KRAYCLKTQPATGETYPKSDLFNKAGQQLKTVKSRVTALYSLSFFLSSDVRFSYKKRVIEALWKK
ncbi:hypothetical protein NT650_14025, partial [Enterobacter hormaechei]|nr:hypothetical protein [Enterobacter hormaechei]